MPVGHRQKNKALEENPKPCPELEEGSLVIFVVRIDLARRGGLQIIQRIAGIERAGGVRRTERQSAGTACPAQIRLNIAVCRRVGGGDVVFEGPGLLGSVDLTEVVDAGVLL